MTDVMKKMTCFMMTTQDHEESPREVSDAMWVGVQDVI
jgi:hypothetical protein